MIKDFIPIKKINQQNCIFYQALTAISKVLGNKYIKPTKVIALSSFLVRKSSLFLHSV